MAGIAITHLRAGRRRVERLREAALAAGSGRFVAHYEELLIDYEIILMAAEQREAHARRTAPPAASPDEG